MRNLHMHWGQQNIINKIRKIQRLNLSLTKSARREHSSICSHTKGPPWRVLFLGTDEFARHHLTALHNEQLKNAVNPLIDRLDVTVCTENCDVLRYASKNNLTVKRWPVTDIDGQYDVGVVTSFGHLIPKKIIEKFPKGMLNVHPSLLPAWRGASPIIHTILNGETTTGISVMSIQPKKFDMGPLLAQEEVSVPEGFTSIQLMRYLAQRGSSMLLDCLRGMNSKPLHTQPNKTTTPYAHKVQCKHSFISWEKQCMVHIDRHYRGISDIYPLRTRLGDKVIKLMDLNILSKEVYKSTVLPVLPDLATPGTALYHKKLELVFVRCKDGWVGFQKVVVKKPMTALAFHNGYLSKQKRGEFRFTSEENDLDFFWR